MSLDVKKSAHRYVPADTYGSAAFYEGMFEGIEGMVSGPSESIYPLESTVFMPLLRTFDRISGERSYM